MKNVSYTKLVLKLFYIISQIFSTFIMINQEKITREK